jgi:N-acyl-D-amino-acid deacylase
MTESFDWIVRGARIVDGTGRPSVDGDVAIRGDRIARIGRLGAGRAQTEIKAEGRVLCPGLVDAHLHTDLMVISQADQEPSIRQGVTAHVIGQDGVSYAPGSPATQRYFRDYFAAINGDPAMTKSWRSVSEFLDAVDGAGVNAVYLLPHGTIRYEVMGHDDRPPSTEELSRMRSMVVEGMEQGAVGLSTGLEYLPGAYAATDELVALCEPAGRAGGVYVTHMRSYQPARVAEAFRETIEIGRRARLPVHISHFNGRADQLEPLVEEAVKAGADLTYETYPYLAGCTILAKDGMPIWVQEGGREATLRRLGDPAIRKKLAEWFAAPNYPWSAFQVAFAESDGDRELEGMRLDAAARKRGQEIGDFVCDLLIRNRSRVACIVHNPWRTEEDVIRLMRRREHMGGSDGIYTGSRPHPRGFGAFARYLEYGTGNSPAGVVMPLEQMIHHLSDRPSRRFGLRDRGQIREGYYADLFLFDPGRIHARSTYENGAQFAEGVDWVWVNGRPALAEGKMTGERGGRAVRR